MPRGLVYYLEDPADASGWAGRWLSRQRVDWSAKTIQWFPLCRHGSSWSRQDSHPHPICNHAANAIYFTSDRTGHRAAYRVEIPADR